MTIKVIILKAPSSKVDKKDMQYGPEVPNLTDMFDINWILFV